MKTFAFLAIFGLAVTAAVAAIPEQPENNQAVQIECQLHYRAEPGQAFDSKELTIKIPLTDGPVVEINRSQTVTHTFKDMKVQLRYDVNTLHILVTDTKTDQPIMATLYQMGPGLKNQFSSHGFTGLSYIEHPTTTAQLQTWCAVAE